MNDFGEAIEYSEAETWVWRLAALRSGSGSRRVPLSEFWDDLRGMGFATAPTTFKMCAGSGQSCAFPDPHYMIEHGPSDGLCMLTPICRLF